MKRLLLAAVLISACAHLTQQDKDELDAFKVMQNACIEDHKAEGKAAIDACIVKVRADWCQNWADRFDAGVCQ